MDPAKFDISKYGVFLNVLWGTREFQKRGYNNWFENFPKENKRKEGVK